MHIFFPYQQVTPNDGTLSLVLPKRHQWIHWTAYRLLPLLVLSGALSVFMTWKSQLPWWALGGLLVTAIFALPLFSKRIITAISVTPDHISQEMLTLLWFKKRYHIDQENILEIQEVNKDAPRGGAIIYQIVLKNDKKWHLFALPTYPAYDPERFKAVREALETYGKRPISQ